VSPLLRRPTFEWFAVTVMCMVIVVLAALEGWLWRIDQSIYDSTLSAFMRPPSSDVVIIAIDDASLASLGRWPWSRRTHAALGTGPGGRRAGDDDGPDPRHAQP
jgi:CHASE2 domain-containing sensor protein